MDNLRKPFFVVAVVVIAVAILVELGGGAVVGAHRVAQQLDVPNPGLGIPYLALLDGLIAYTMLLMISPFLITERVHGRLQGIASLVVSLLAIIGGIFMILAAVALLLLMVAMLVAVPFGTLAYMALFGSFERGSAAMVLSMVMTLKLVFAGCLLLAHQRFLQNKGLVIIVAVSLLCTLIVQFLHGLVPLFLVSITDAIAAIVVAAIGVLWAVFILFGSIPAIVKAAKFRVHAAA
ncbi:MAG: hypothetical protein HY704_01390 [Gemmatimonadetes bacterium]|nr:hypothetical protein [Gemmatimonadota bacterium]